MLELLEGLLVGLWEILAELFSGILWPVLELWFGLWGSILVLLNLMLMVRTGLLSFAVWCAEGCGSRSGVCDWDEGLCNF